MAWLIPEIVQLVGIVLLLILVAALIAPFESLGWWAGWDQRWRGPATLEPADPSVYVEEEGGAQWYVVYLSGVGALDPEELTEKEDNFLNLLDACLPGAIIIRDVFPYSVTNNPLTGRRRIATFYKNLVLFVQRTRLTPLLLLVTTRNLFQVAVSADRRYGPIYNFGVAREIAMSLVNHGYHLGDPQPVIVMGLSGGGQIAVGCVPSLKRILRAPVWVVSIGGVLTSDTGIKDVQHVFHLSGSQDHIQYTGAVLYPGRWPIFRASTWNREMARGKMTIIDMGPMKHMGHGDYMSRSARLPNGETHVDKTVAVIADAIRSIRVPTSQAHA